MKRWVEGRIICYKFVYQLISIINAMLHTTIYLDYLDNCAIANLSISSHFWTVSKQLPSTFCDPSLVLELWQKKLWQYATDSWATQLNKLKKCKTKLFPIENLELLTLDIPIKRQCNLDSTLNSRVGIGIYGKERFDSFKKGMVFFAVSKSLSQTHGF